MLSIRTFVTNHIFRNWSRRQQRCVLVDLLPSAYSFKNTRKQRSLYYVLNFRWHFPQLFLSFSRLARRKWRYLQRSSPFSTTCRVFTSGCWSRIMSPRWPCLSLSLWFEKRRASANTCRHSERTGTPVTLIGLVCRGQQICPETGAVIKSKTCSGKIISREFLDGSR